MPIFNVGAYVYDWITDQGIWKAQITTLVDHFGDRPESPRVLDLGCGPGVSTFALAERIGEDAEIVGIDLAPQMIKRALAHHRSHFSRLKNLRFEVADATELPFADHSFDVAVGHSFLYLVPDRVAVLREVRRVLAPGGVLVLMEPNRDGSLLAAAKRSFDHPEVASLGASERLRFTTSMVLWRVVSGAAGRMHPRLVQRLFREGGFEKSSCHPTLGGLGLHCVGS